MADINIKNMSENTRYCSDSNGNSEFKCVCHEGFVGTLCEFKCPLECNENEICVWEIESTTSIEKWRCGKTCASTPCQASGIFY